MEGGEGGDYFPTNIGNFPFYKSFFKRLKICKNCYKNKFVKLNFVIPHFIIQSNFVFLPRISF